MGEELFTLRVNVGRGKPLVVVRKPYELQEQELTGLEEHLHDEAHECGELAARRLEAEAEARADYECSRFEEMWQHDPENPERLYCGLSGRIFVTHGSHKSFGECEPELIPF